MKNPNGYGTVYKLKGRRRRSWVARVTVGWEIVDEKARQQYQTVGYFLTKQEAMKALVAYRASPVSPRADLTLGALYEEWSLSKYRKVSKDTARCYQGAWAHLASLAKAEARDIRTAHWQAIVDGCAAKGLSRSLLEKVRIVAGMLSDYAMQNDIVNKNYAKFIELPKAERTKKERFSDLEIRQIEKQVDAVPWADTVLILIYTGLRISELLNLTRFNVNLEQQMLVGGVKTDAGKNRPIPLHPKIFKHIKRRVDQGGDALICDEKGRKLSTKRYREKMYYPALAAIGVRDLSPHACRHTFGSLMAEAGVSTVYIQKLIGHTDYAFTANEYTHPGFEALREAIGRI